MDEMVSLPLDLIDANPKQPRKVFDQTALEELAQNIRVNGLMEPVLVRPKDGRYELVAGERRARACRLIELTAIPAVVRDVDDLQLAILSLVENVCRRDLSVIEEADHYIRLLGMGLDFEQIAERVALPVVQVQWKVEMRRKAIPQVIWLVQNGTMTGSMAWRVAKLSANGQMRFLREVNKQPMTAQEQMGLAEGILADESKIDMFPETQLTEEQVQAARTFHEVIDRAVRVCIRLEKMDGPSLLVGLATEFGQDLAALGYLIQRLQAVRRKLERTRGKAKGAPNDSEAVRAADEGRVSDGRGLVCYAEKHPARP